VFSSLLLTTHGLTQIVNAFPLIPIIVAFYIGKLNNNKKCWSFMMYFSLREQVHIPLPTFMVDVLFFIIKIIFPFDVFHCVLCAPCCVLPLLLVNYFVVQERGRRKTPKLPMEQAMANP
jgi:hypothetical protein